MKPICKVKNRINLVRRRAIYFSLPPTLPSIKGPIRKRTILGSTICPKPNDHEGEQAGSIPGSPKAIQHNSIEVGRSASEDITASVNSDRYVIRLMGPPLSTRQ